MAESRELGGLGTPAVTASARRLQLFDEAGVPAMDVVLPQGGKRGRMARAALRERHGERALDGEGDAPDVVGIDEQCLGQLASRAGAIREHEDARVIRI